MILINNFYVGKFFYFLASNIKYYAAKSKKKITSFNY